MEGNFALRQVPVEREGKEYPGWHPIEAKSRYMFKVEFAVILGMTDEAAAAGSQRLRVV